MRKLGVVILKVSAFDIVVSVLSALACLGAVLHLPVWSLFIGWAWYLALGSKKEVICEAGLTCILSALLALSAVVLSDVFQPFCGSLGASMLSVLLIIFLLMMLLKHPQVKHPLVAFNSFSCIFAGYYLQAFPVQPEYFWNLFYVFVWITGTNILGLFVGWLSIALTNLHKTVIEE